jgi:hypothetical protein
MDGRNVVGISGLPKLIMELTAFDESQQLREALKEKLPIYTDLAVTKEIDDWSHLLVKKGGKDPY